MTRSTSLAVRISIAVFAAVISAMAQAPTTTSVPVVIGPVTGPGPVFPGLMRMPAETDLPHFKYTLNEYFISGTAAGKPYTTRILVRQPSDPGKFSGIVVAEAMHPSGNSWMFFNTHTYTMSAGHISLEIVTASPERFTKFNAERYKSLSVQDGQANEIIAQAGALVKSNSKGSPLAGLRVRRIILMGTSASAAILRTYLNAHPIYRMPDKSPIFDGFLPTSTGGDNPIVKVDVPVVHIPTMTEVNGAAKNGAKYRRADGDEPGNQYRLYEFAGMGHNDSRENPTYEPDPCKFPVSRYPLGAYMAVGLHHLIQWVDRGKTPPHAERILVDADTGNDGSLLELDAYGNAKGGIRTTYTDVPVAKYAVPTPPGDTPVSNPSAPVAERGTAGPGFFCGIAAYQLPLPMETLRALYKDKKDYQTRVDQSLKKLTEQGWFLPVYRDLVLADAASANVP